MKLYSYVVARDYGFAPNPFFGACTLATCKPEIRKRAEIGDLVIGTGSKRFNLQGHIVFAMRVAETLTFDEYWNDQRFRVKKPNLMSSLKLAYGDNIYHHDLRSEEWVQEDSHHSLPNGAVNLSNVAHDTRVNRVLIGTEFIYFGGDGPLILPALRGGDKSDICWQSPGHRCNFPDATVRLCESWITSLGWTGYCGRPRLFSITKPDARRRA